VSTHHIRGAQAHKDLNRMGAWIDLLLMLLTFVATIVWNVEVGIIVSVMFSLLLVVRRSSQTRLTLLVSRRTSSI